MCYFLLALATGLARGCGVGRLAASGVATFFPCALPLRGAAGRGVTRRGKPLLGFKVWVADFFSKRRETEACQLRHNGSDVVRRRDFAGDGKVVVKEQPVLCRKYLIEVLRTIKDFGSQAHNAHPIGVPITRLDVVIHSELSKLSCLRHRGEKPCGLVTRLGVVDYVEREVEADLVPAKTNRPDHGHVTARFLDAVPRTLVRVTGGVGIWREAREHDHDRRPRFDRRGSIVASGGSLGCISDEALDISAESIDFLVHLHGLLSEHIHHAPHLGLFGICFGSLCLYRRGDRQGRGGVLTPGARH